MPDFFEQLRIAQKVVREIGAVLEDIQHAGGERGVAVQSRQYIRAGEGFLEEMLETLPAAVQRGGGHGLRQQRRPLVQEARQAAGGNRGIHFRFERRSFGRQAVVHGFLRVDDALVDLPHGRQVFVQVSLEGFGGGRLTASGGEHLAGQQSRARPGRWAGCGFAGLRRIAAGAPGAAGIRRRWPGARIRRRREGPCRAGGRAPAWCLRGAPTVHGRRAGVGGTAPGIRYRGCRRASA